jgi:flagellar protein YcgR/PilZ domain-containing protein
MDPSRIVVGKPLPFSIFTADGKLLLAQGRVVESDRLRDMLIRNGQRSEISGPDADSGGGADTLSLKRAREAEREAEQAARDTPLERLYRDYEEGSDGHHLSISMAKSEADKAFPVQLMGVHGQSIIVTAPVHQDGSLVPVLAGQTWLCRTFQMTSAFRFSAIVAKVMFEPFPHLYLKLRKEVEHRNVRGAPRAKVCLRAEVRGAAAYPCIVADLSTSGARIACEANVDLDRNQACKLVATFNVLSSKFDLSLDGTVVNLLGPSDTRHREVAFFGLKFNPTSEMDGLVLHGYVGEHLLSEFHSLWQMLKMAAS